METLVDIYKSYKNDTQLENDSVKININLFSKMRKYQRSSHKKVDFLTGRQFLPRFKAPEGKSYAIPHRALSVEWAGVLKGFE